MSAPTSDSSTRRAEIAATSFTQRLKWMEGSLIEYENEERGTEREAFYKAEYERRRNELVRDVDDALAERARLTAENADLRRVLAERDTMGTFEAMLDSSHPEGNPARAIPSPGEAPTP